MPTTATSTDESPTRANSARWLCPVAATAIAAFLGGYIVIDPGARHPKELYYLGAALTFVVTVIALSLHWKRVPRRSSFDNAWAGCAIAWPLFMNLGFVASPTYPDRLTDMVRAEVPQNQLARLDSKGRRYGHTGEEADEMKAGDPPGSSKWVYFMFDMIGQPPTRQWLYGPLLVSAVCLLLIRHRRDRRVDGSPDQSAQS
jgi:hypothetical protein